jgi:hypothetical protein
MSHPALHRASLPQIWFGLFGAPLVWAVQFAILYALLARACYPGLAPRQWMDVETRASLPLILTAVATAVAALSALIAWKNWRAAGRERRGSVEGLLAIGEGRTRFMALSGLMLSLLFLFAILLNGVVMLQLHRCW